MRVLFTCGYFFVWVVFREGIILMRVVFSWAYFVVRLVFREGIFS